MGMLSMTRRLSDGASSPEQSRCMAALYARRDRGRLCRRSFGESFLRKVGSVYPAPSWGKGRGARWDKEKIDLARTGPDGTPPTSSTPRTCFSEARRETGDRLAAIHEATPIEGGIAAFYWVPHERDRQAGFTLEGEALGSNFEAAAARARLLNAHLDAWREGRSVPTDVALAHRVGTIDWWHQNISVTKRLKSSNLERKQTIAARSDDR